MVCECMVLVADGGGTIDAVEFSKSLEVMKTKLTDGKGSLTDWVWRHVVRVHAHCVRALVYEYEQAVLLVMFISLGLLFTCLFRCSYRYMFGEAADILVAANFNTFSSSITIVFQVLTSLLAWVLSFDRHRQYLPSIAQINHANRC